MKMLGIEEIMCPNCGHVHDVPVYDNQGHKTYGMKFCSQCGASLFYESRTYTLSKKFIDWLTNQYYMLYCDNQDCKDCPFHSKFNGLGKQCNDLEGDERLVIIKRILDKEKNNG